MTLTTDQIEIIRKHYEKYRNHAVFPNLYTEISALCDLALKGLAVAEEAPIDPEALRLAREFVADPDKRAQVKVMIAHHIGPKTADLIDEAVIVSRALLAVSEKAPHG